MLEEELKYFIDNQIELLKKYRGKFLVIKNQGVVGIYESEIEAYQEAQKKYELGTFLIQECTLGKDAYSQTFYSRVGL